MIRPWYRSRLFWLGVPGLVFLLWVWIAVPQTFNSFSWETTRFQVIAAVQSHKLTVVKRPFPNVVQTTNRGIKLRPGLLSSYSVGGPSSYPLRVRKREIGPGVVVSDATISTWVLVPTYIVIWMGVMLWWQRRKRRISAQQIPAA